MKNSHKFIGIPFIRKIIFRESNCIHDSFITYKLWPTSFNIGVFRSPIATLVKATSLAMELNSGLKNNYFDIANDDWKIKTDRWGRSFPKDWDLQQTRITVIKGVFVKDSMTYYSLKISIEDHSSRAQYWQQRSWRVGFFTRGFESSIESKTNFREKFCFPGIWQLGLSEWSHRRHLDFELGHSNRSLVETKNYYNQIEGKSSWYGGHFDKSKDCCNWSHCYKIQNQNAQWSIMMVFKF